MNFKNLYSKKILPPIRRLVADVITRFSDELTRLIFLNLLLIFAQVIYISLRFEYLNPEVPLWYSRTWGILQLAQKKYLYIIPVLSSLIFLGGLLFVFLLRKIYFRNIGTLVGLTTLFPNFLLTIFSIRIIFRASKPFTPLIDPVFLSLILYFLLAFFVALLFLPAFVDLMFEKGIVTNPHLHKHPGMLLREPSARGGGLFYSLAFAVLGFLFVGVNSKLLPLYLGVLLLGFLGIFDDIQNTNINSKLRFLENPLIRLIFLFLITCVVLLGDVVIKNVTLPFSTNVFSFNSSWVSGIFTVIWIVWVMNVLSWSNGIDGQYGGIVGMASLTILFLSLRFTPISPSFMDAAILAAISAGLAFGFTKKTWHPSKIMWGFGAMSAGFVLSYLSILNNSKIVTSTLVILIPFMDGVFTFIRRITQKKNPLKGDGGHLHHILLKKGWSIQKIALFYWFTTALFGLIGYLTADKLSWQMGLIMVGLVGFGITILNIKSSEHLPQQQ